MDEGGTQDLVIHKIKLGMSRVRRRVVGSRWHTGFYVESHDVHRCPLLNQENEQVGQRSSPMSAKAVLWVVHTLIYT